MADLHQLALESWKNNRRAIVHTLDISDKHSKHAKKIVEGFRDGMYANNVDFHVGDVSDWIAKQKTSRHTQEPFLTYVFLDLPNADRHLMNVAPVLRVNGILAVFNPSITQIVHCVEAIREQKMPYLLDQVVELGAGSVREWTVRAVVPRATLRKMQGHDSTETLSADVTDQATREEEFAKGLVQSEEKWATICRPTPGQQVMSSGFLAIWRRMEQVATQERDASES